MKMFTSKNLTMEREFQNHEYLKEGMLVLPKGSIISLPYEKDEKNEKFRFEKYGGDRKIIDRCFKNLRYSKKMCIDVYKQQNKHRVDFYLFEFVCIRVKTLEIPSVFVIDRTLVETQLLSNTLTSIP